MEKFKTEHTRIECPKLGSTANLTLEFIHIPLKGNYPSDFKCDSCMNCGVAVLKEGSVTYNWKACPVYGEIAKEYAQPSPALAA